MVLLFVMHVHCIHSYAPPHIIPPRITSAGGLTVHTATLTVISKDILMRRLRIALPIGQRGARVAQVSQGQCREVQFAWFDGLVSIRWRILLWHKAYHLSLQHTSDTFALTYITCYVTCTPLSTGEKQRVPGLPCMSWPVLTAVLCAPSHVKHH